MKKIVMLTLLLAAFSSHVMGQLEFYKKGEESHFRTPYISAITVKEEGKADVVLYSARVNPNLQQPGNTYAYRLYDDGRLKSNFSIPMLATSTNAKHVDFFKVGQTIWIEHEFILYGTNSDRQYFCANDEPFFESTMSGINQLSKTNTVGINARTTGVNVVAKVGSNTALALARGTREEGDKFFYAIDSDSRLTTFKDALISGGGKFDVTVEVAAYEKPADWVQRTFDVQCDGYDNSYSWVGGDVKTVSLSQTYPVRPEPTAAATVTPYKETMAQERSKISVNGASIALNDCATNGLLFDFYSDPIFDFYYDRSKCIVSLNSSGGAQAVQNSGVTPLKGMLVSLNGAVANGDKLTIGLWHKASNKITKTFTYTLNVNHTSEVTFTTTTGNPYCNTDDTWHFTANMPGGYALESVFAPAVAEGNNNYSIKTDNESRIDYTYTYGSCKVTADFAIPAKNSPIQKPTLTSTSALACNDEPVSLTASNTATSLTYSWTVNGASVNGVNGAVLGKAYLKESSSNSVTVRAVAADGCSSEVSAAVNVRLHTLNPDLAFASDTRCSNADSYSLLSLLSGADKDKVVSNQSGYTYAFNTPAGLSVSGTEVAADKSTAGSYTATLKINQAGCSIQKTAAIAILPLFDTPVLSASTTHFCDDGASDVTLTLDNYDALKGTPKSYMLNSNGVSSSWTASSAAYALSPLKGADGTNTQVSVSVTEQSTGCTLTSNAVDVKYYTSPRRPNLSGRFNYCGSDTYTTLLHDNPEYHVQYWLYDVTNGANTLKMHKGANFWIFRPDQHPEQAPGSGVINTEAYHDLMLGAGKYEIRAPHDYNGCITTLPFEVTNFDNASYQLLGLDNILHVCNSHTDGVHVLSLFKDSEFKTALLNEENADMQYTWTASHGESGAVLPAMRNGKYLSVAEAEPGTYSVTLTLSYGGCHRAFATDLVVDDRPAPFRVSSSTALACDGAAAVLTADNAAVNGLTYKWYVDNVEQAGFAASTASVTLADGAHRVHAEAYDASGCFVASENRVEVEAWTIKTDITMQSAAVSECERDEPLDLYEYLVGDGGDLELLKDEHNAKGLNFRFSGMTVRYNATRHHLADFADNHAKGNGDPYRLKFEVWQNDHSGCVRSYERNVKVLSRPAAFTLSATPNVTSVCNTDNVSVTASNSGVSGLMWAWQNNGTAIAGKSGATLGKEELGVGDNLISATAKTVDGCATPSTNKAAIAVYTLNPAVSFTAAEVSYCANAEAFSLLDLIAGADKEAVLNGSNGYTYGITWQSGLSVSNDYNTYIVSPAQSTPKSYAVTLRVSQNGCSVEKTITVTILPTPAAFTLSATNTLVCNSESVSVTASNSGVSGLTWAWKVNGAAVNGVNAATLDKAYLSQGSNSIIATATNGSSCAAVSPAVQVTLHTVNPDVSFTTTEAAYCTNADAFSLLSLLDGTDKTKVLSNEDGYTYELVYDGLSVSNDYGKFEVNPAQSAPRDYTVALKISQGGCSVEKSMKVTILSAPAAFTLSVTNALVCNSEDVSVTASNSGVSGLTWAWEVNGAAVSGVNVATLDKAHLSQGSNSVVAIATNSSGCSTVSPAVQVTLHTVNPDVSFTAAEAAYCTNAEAFSLLDLIGGTNKAEVLNGSNGYTYSITTMPGGLSVDNSGSYKVSPAGSTPQSYTVTLKVFQNGCSVEKSMKITILPTPVAFTLAATNALVCNSENVSVTASNSGVGGLTWAWKVNGAAVGGVNAATLGKAHLSQGSNSVVATATNGSGCAVVSPAVQVVLHTVNPDVNFTNATVAYCTSAGAFSLHTLLGGTDKATVLDGSNGYTYTITTTPGGLAVDNSFGDYSVSPANSTPQSYTVTLKIFQNGCSIEKTMALTINPVPGAFTISTTKPSQVLGGVETYLLCNASDFDVATSALSHTAQVQWYSNDNLVNSTPNGSYTYAMGADGVATMKAVAVSDKGCTTTSTNTLNVDRRTVDFSGISVATAPTAYCNGDDNVNYFTFVAAANKADIEGSSNGWSYTLDGGGISQCQASNPKMVCPNNSAPGVYTTELRVSNNGCFSSWSKVITIRPVPGATTLTANTTNLCANGAAIMTASAQNHINTYTYNWYKDGAVTPTRSGSNSQTENYASEGGVGQATWKVAAVDNECTGAMSNDIITSQVWRQHLPLMRLVEIWDLSSK